MAVKAKVARLMLSFLFLITMLLTPNMQDSHTRGTSQ
jgi:hypothetical protein